MALTTNPRRRKKELQQRRKIAQKITGFDKPQTVKNTAVPNVNFTPEENTAFVKAFQERSKLGKDEEREKFLDPKIRSAIDIAEIESIRRSQAEKNRKAELMQQIAQTQVQEEGEKLEPIEAFESLAARRDIEKVKAAEVVTFPGTDVMNPLGEAEREIKRIGQLVPIVSDAILSIGKWREAKTTTVARQNREKAFSDLDEITAGVASGEIPPSRGREVFRYAQESAIRFEQNIHGDGRINPAWLVDKERGIYLEAEATQARKDLDDKMRALYAAEAQAAVGRIGLNE